MVWTITAIYGNDIRHGCDHFVDIRKFAAAESAKIINDYGIDILIDLVGHLRGNRMAIAALRPAPIQVRWLGMAGTTGADFFDYIITDRTVTPQNQQQRIYRKVCVYAILLSDKRRHTIL
jgi:protein O-GlcNAc transferase